jgi:hypothetical protein
MTTPPSRSGVVGVLINAAEVAFWALAARIGWELGGIVFHMLHH